MRKNEMGFHFQRSLHAAGRKRPKSPLPALMRSYVLTASVLLNAPRREVFAFFADAENLETITPPWLHFQILTRAPIAMGPGTLIDYRLRLYRVPFRWRTEISAWQPPQRFVDRQLRGPYSHWIHEHFFQETEDGTVVVDGVRYWPRGGTLSQALFVGREVQRIFAYRQARMVQLFGGREGKLSLRRAGEEELRRGRRQQAGLAASDGLPGAHSSSD